MFIYFIIFIFFSAGMRLSSLSEKMWRNEVRIRFERLADEFDFRIRCSNDLLYLIYEDLLVVQIFLGNPKKCWVGFSGEEKSECRKTNQYFKERNWNKIERHFRLMAKQFNPKNPRKDRFQKLKVSLFFLDFTNIKY